MRCGSNWHPFGSFSSVQFSSVQADMYALGKAHMRSSPSFGSFPNVAFVSQAPQHFRYSETQGACDGCFFPPVYLLCHFLWLRHAQASTPTGVFDGGCRTLTHATHTWHMRHKLWNTVSFVCTQTWAFLRTKQGETQGRTVSLVSYFVMVMYILRNSRNWLYNEVAWSVSTERVLELASSLTDTKVGIGR